MGNRREPGMHDTVLAYLHYTKMRHFRSSKKRSGLLSSFRFTRYDYSKPPAPSFSALRILVFPFLPGPNFERSNFIQE